jgi:hypothetical protein
MQFSQHGLLGVFTPVNAALWKLPAVAADSFAPKNLILMVHQDDANIGPKAVSVQHNQLSIFSTEFIMHSPFDSSRGFKRIGSIN